MRKEIVLTALGIVITLGASTVVATDLLGVLVEQLGRGRWLASIGHLLFAFIVACLIYGGLVYQLTRIAHLRRSRAHRPAPRATLERLYDDGAPTLTVLVPAYREEPAMVIRTLLSAALQDYPSRRVVLLIDDPPTAGDVESARQLAAARALPQRVRDLLAAAAAHFAEAERDFLERSTRGRIDRGRELARLAVLNERACGWFDERIQRAELDTHEDRCFVQHVLMARRDCLAARARELRELSAASTVEIGDRVLVREYRKLAALFDVQVTSFERKRYQNLSHEPNKAMNLNAYLGLMGGHFRERLRDDGRYLEPVAASVAELSVPNSDYVVTLDADSLIVPDYALRLVHLAQQPGHERLAVVQTPYSAFPGAPGALERVAGATTDIQYLIHQGFTGFAATYWVGANALLRKVALDDIAHTVQERGHPVRVFIQDRTVIEDTESTVDLIDRGWQLHNYPRRMAFSATPPDFGSLLIQRRRWANGGLIILPKLLRYLARGPRNLARLGEGFMRIHYLASIAAVNFGLVIILAVPFSESLASPWLPLTAVPYFFLYARDLSRIGYRASDVLRVYALNLLLIPVNIGGVAKSLQQAWTKSKIPFGRTPKIDGRTAAAPVYVAAEYLLVAHWSVQAVVDAAAGRYFHGAFAMVNTLFLLWAIVTFLGLRESWQDLSLAWGGRHAASFTPGVGLEAPLAGAAPEPRSTAREWSSHEPAASPPPHEGPADSGPRSSHGG